MVSNFSEYFFLIFLNLFVLNWVIFQLESARANGLNVLQQTSFTLTTHFEDSGTK